VFYPDKGDPAVGWSLIDTSLNSNRSNTNERQRFAQASHRATLPAAPDFKHTQFGAVLKPLGFISPWTRFRLITLRKRSLKPIFARLDCG
jgi:hypothetical protein